MALIDSIPKLLLSSYGLWRGYRTQNPFTRSITDRHRMFFTALVVGLLIGASPLAVHLVRLVLIGAAEEKTLMALLVDVWYIMGPILFILVPILYGLAGYFIGHFECKQHFRKLNAGVIPQTPLLGEMLYLTVLFPIAGGLVTASLVTAMATFLLIAVVVYTQPMSLKLELITIFFLLCVQFLLIRRVIEEFLTALIRRRAGLSSWPTTKSLGLLFLFVLVLWVGIVPSALTYHFAPIFAFLFILLPVLLMEYFSAVGSKMGLRQARRKLQTSGAGPNS